MDIGRGLTFITEDPRWKEKIAIGTGVMLVSTLLSMVFIGVIGILLVMGYGVRLLQNVRDGHTYPLPEWDQWSEDLIRGAKLVVVLLVYALPSILISIPLALGSAMADGRGAAEFVGTTLAICSGCLLALYSIFLYLIMPGFTIAYARDETISSGLQIREIWQWTQANIGQVVIVTLVVLVANIVIYLAALITGFLLICIGLIVTIPLGALVILLFQYHLYGQLAAAFPYTGVGVDYSGSNLYTGPSSGATYTEPVPPPPAAEPDVATTTTTMPIEPAVDDEIITDYPDSGIDAEPPITPPDEPDRPVS
jgi:hypothetical protein